MTTARGARPDVFENARAAALALGVGLVLLLFFSPSWALFRAWSRVPEVFAQAIQVRRGAYVETQVTDPSVEIDDPFNQIIRWRLLIPLLGHYLRMPPALVLGLSYVGCFLVLAFTIRIARRRGFSWSECAMLAVVVGAGSWFFASTGWLGYYDSWLVLGLLTVAWVRDRRLVWLACALTPWIDERFVLGFPLAVLVRWLSRVPAGSTAGGLVRWLVRDMSIAMILVAAYVPVRLWLAGQVWSQTVGDYIDYMRINVKLGETPPWRLGWGAWEGLRAGWIPVAVAAGVAFARRRFLDAGLLVIGVCATTVAGVVTAADISRSVAPVVPVVPLGWELGRAEAWWPRWHVAPVVAALALLLPASQVISTITIPVDQLWFEVRSLYDPKPPFSSDPYVRDAQIAANQGNLERAAELASIGVRLEPSANTHNVYGVVLARQGRWADALREFDAALTLDDGFTDGFMNRARARAALHDRQAARRDAERARELAGPTSDVAAQAAELLRLLDEAVR